MTSYDLVLIANNKDPWQNMNVNIVKLLYLR